MQSTVFILTVTYHKRMRLLIFILILTSNVNCVFSQTEKESIDSIRSRFKWINEHTDFTITELNNEDYLEHMPDNGGQLKGYFINDTLYKIVEWLGPSYAIMITEYYLWNNDLIFVYDIEKNYNQIIDSTDGFIGFDYSKTEIKYESRHYFVDGKEIRKLEKGKRLMEPSIPHDFKSNVEGYRTVLVNKKNNQTTYDLIQGKWISTIDSLSSMEFEGLTKVDYYDGKYLDQSKIKIEEGFLYCWTRKDIDEFKYEIMSLTDNNLTLLYLPVGRLLTYEKENDR